MISLLVTVLVTILLASIAIGTGSNYVKKSQNQKDEVFRGALSLAVSQRGEDAYVNSDLYPYLGYEINDSGVFETIFASKTKETVVFEDGIWYIVDADTAVRLGVKEADSYLGNVENAGRQKVALVNYLTGDVYLIEASSTEVKALPLT